MVTPTATVINMVASTPLELWGGVECTVNRVGEEYFDQLELSGHSRRLDDLEKFAGLGLRTLRYPVLWERIAPESLDQPDWSWSDRRLGRLRELGIRPIVGFLHHGSGPRYTDLLDPEFPNKLEAFAGAFAERYPWVELYTPINEPLTTARFSGLYGHWYPHHRDTLSFARAFLNQCRGISSAMHAIREVNPAAGLVQTEDLGKTYSAPSLNYQAEFENERRWLTFDILSGWVIPGSSMYEYLAAAGVAQKDLDWFVLHPAPPDMIGINHYVTSERFLDDRIEFYPSSLHGGNGIDRYVDVEAVRVCTEGILGPYGMLCEAWERYHLPLVVTEAHLGCTSDEQLRWLKEVWDAAQRARREGKDVRAVTAWALLGSYDWDSLLTRIEGNYEAGAFNVCRGTPRPTELAGLIVDLAAGRDHQHPVFDEPGWWRRDDRLLYPSISRHALQCEAECSMADAFYGSFS